MVAEGLAHPECEAVEVREASLEEVRIGSEKVELERIENLDQVFVEDDGEALHLPLVGVSHDMRSIVLKVDGARKVEAVGDLRGSDDHRDGKPSYPLELDVSFFQIV